MKKKSAKRLLKTLKASKSIAIKKDKELVKKHIKKEVFLNSL